jgi:tetratricopeptide (TPR) repeat protein
MKYGKLTKVPGILLAFILLIACSSIQGISQGVTISPPTATLAQNSVTQTVVMTQSPLPQITVKVYDSEVFCSTDNEDARKAYNDALGNEDLGKFDEAEQLYRRAIEIDPNYCDAMDNLGKLLRQQGRIDEAIDWYKQSLEILPDNTVAIQNLASAYLFQGKWEEAIQEYERLTEIAPENPEGFYGLGTTYLNLQQPEKAVEFLETADTLYDKIGSPYVVDTRYYLGIANYMQKDCTKAIDYLEQVYPQFVDDGGVNYILGGCYLLIDSPDIETAKIYILKAQELGVEIPSEILLIIGE